MLIYQKTHHVSRNSITIINILTKNLISLDLCLLSSSDVYEILPTEKKKVESNIWVLIIFQLNIPVYENTYVWKRKRVWRNIHCCEYWLHDDDGSGKGTSMSSSAFIHISF